MKSNATDEWRFIVSSFCFRYYRLASSEVLINGYQIRYSARQLNTTAVDFQIKTYRSYTVRVFLAKVACAFCGAAFDNYSFLPQPYRLKNFMCTPRKIVEAPDS
jgi:hypothetical protein